MAIICILSGSQAWFIMMNEMNLKEKLLLKHAYAFLQMRCGAGITMFQSYSRDFGICPCVPMCERWVLASLKHSNGPLVASF